MRELLRYVTSGGGAINTRSSVSGIPEVKKSSKFTKCHPELVSGSHN